MINFGEEIAEPDFEAFGAFVRDHWGTLQTLRFSERVRELLQNAQGNDVWAFRSNLRRRLLIAGHDLKFIKGAHSRLERYFEVRYDEWPSERVHDKQVSLDLLDWAEVVWAEWMTACSVWYSDHVRPHQLMVVRAHFYEITRDSGFALNWDNVDAVIAIALHTYEDIVEKFQFPRERVRLIPNFYDTEGYRISSDPERVFRLALVGSVPARKGLARAYEVLRRLRGVDDRYTLTIFGKRAEDYPWIHGDARERSYFAACADFLTQHSLEDAVIFEGWVDTKERLGDYGFILSTSDFEGSHVAPGEAFAALNEGVFLDWRGARYVYPERTIKSNLDGLVELILDGRTRDDSRQRDIESTRDFLRENQGTEQFVSEVVNLVRELTPIE